MSKDEKVVNEFLNHGLNNVAKKLGRTREEVFNRMKQDTQFRSEVNREIGNEIKATTNTEVREAAKRLRKE